MSASVVANRRPDPIGACLIVSCDHPTVYIHINLVLTRSMHACMHVCMWTGEGRLAGTDKDTCTRKNTSSGRKEAARDSPAEKAIGPPSVQLVGLPKTPQMICLLHASRVW